MRAGDYFMATIFFWARLRSRRNMEIYKWKWTVLGALGCMDKANFEKKNSKWQHYARYLYYLPDITTGTSNLKKDR